MEKYLERIASFTSAKQCEAFEKNARQRGEEALADAAARRRVEILATKHGGSTPAEREGWMAINAYEETLFRKHGKRIKAGRTRQMINRLGMVPAIEKMVSEREWDTQGATALYEVGLGEFTFEPIVVRHPDEFTEFALKQAKDKLAQSAKEREP
jgi:hypothetical protein